MIERLRQPGGTLGTLSLASALLLGAIGLAGLITMLVVLPMDSDFWSANDSDVVIAAVFFAITALGGLGFLIEDRSPWTGAALSVLGGLALALILYWTVLAIVIGLGAAVVAVMRARVMHAGRSHMATPSM